MTCFVHVPVAHFCGNLKYCMSMTMRTTEHNWLEKRVQSLIMHSESMVRMRRNQKRPYTSLLYLLSLHAVFGSSYLIKSRCHCECTPLLYSVNCASNYGVNLRWCKIDGDLACMQAHMHACSMNSPYQACMHSHHRACSI